MALVLGTNCGFVTTAPTEDPGGTAATIDSYRDVSKFTSPATATKITEIGWWCDNATEEANFEVGLYAADGAVVPGEAGTRLYVDDTNAKGTDAGWKRVTVDWDISSNTAYWLGVQLDDTATATKIDSVGAGFFGYDYLAAATNLPNPFGGGAINDPDATDAIYAVWEAGAPSGTNSFINIGDVLKPVSNEYINIGDVWKPVSTEYINIGDSWKKVF